MARRHGAKFSKQVTAEPSADPDDDSEMEVEDSDAEQQIWKLLPQLKSLPQSLLGKIPLAAMFQLNSALQKDLKNTEKLGVNARLAQNAKKAARCPTRVAEGEDNRKDQLHEARFLGGACSSLTDQWGAARAAIGG